MSSLPRSCTPCVIVRNSRPRRALTRTALPLYWGFWDSDYRPPSLLHAEADIIFCQFDWSGIIIFVAHNDTYYKNKIIILALLLRII